MPHAPYTRFPLGGDRGTGIWLCFAHTQGESEGMRPRNAEAYGVSQSRHSQRHPTSAGFVGTDIWVSMCFLGQRPKHEVMLCRQRTQMPEKTQWRQTHNVPASRRASPEAFISVDVRVYQPQDRSVAKHLVISPFTYYYSSSLPSSPTWYYQLTPLLGYKA